MHQVVTTMGLDLAKRVSHVHAIAADGSVTSRLSLGPFFF
jgi:hypothetical protein